LASSYRSSALGFDQPKRWATKLIYAITDPDCPPRQTNAAGGLDPQPLGNRSKVHEVRDVTYYDNQSTSMPERMS